MERKTLNVMLHHSKRVLIFIFQVPYSTMLHLTTCLLLVTVSSTYAGNVSMFFFIMFQKAYCIKIISMYSVTYQ